MRIAQSPTPTHTWPMCTCPPHTTCAHTHMHTCMLAHTHTRTRTHTHTHTHTLSASIKVRLHSRGRPHSPYSVRSRLRAPMAWWKKLLLSRLVRAFSTQYLLREGKSWNRSLAGWDWSAMIHLDLATVHLQYSSSREGSSHQTICPAFLVTRLSPLLWSLVVLPYQTVSKKHSTLSMTAL